MKLLITGIICCSLGTGFATAAEPVGKGPYDKACKSCHGAEGQGNPAIAKALKVTLRHLGSKEVLAKTDAELKNDTVKGIGKMKGVTSLSAKEADDVVAFMRTLKQ